MAYSRTSWLIFMEQKCGPHIEQKCAVFAASAGRVSSWKSRAEVGVQGEVELVLPAEVEAGVGQGVVPGLGAGVGFGEVGGVGGDLVGDDPVFDVVTVGQAEVFFGGDVAEHRGAVPADHRRPDRGGDVVISGCDVRGERSEGVERGLVADFQLQVHVLFDLVHRDVSGAFDHDLHVVFPGDFRELTEGAQLSELGVVVGVGDASRAQPVTEGERHGIGGHQLAHVPEMGVEKVLLVVGQTPRGHDRTQPAASVATGALPGRIARRGG